MTVPFPSEVATVDLRERDEELAHKRQWDTIGRKSTDPPPRGGSAKIYEGGWTPNFRATVTPEEFVAARDKSTRGGYLSGLTVDELKDSKLFLSADGKVGGALSRDGDMMNLFNNGGPKGAATEVLLSMIDQGGITADAFDGYLPTLYANFGLKEVGRMKFNPEYAPTGWNFARDDNPDVVFLALARDNREDHDTIRRRVTGPKDQWVRQQRTANYYEDYDAAKRAATAHARGTSHLSGGGEESWRGLRDDARGDDSPAGEGLRRFVADRWDTRSVYVAPFLLLDDDDDEYGVIFDLDGEPAVSAPRERRQRDEALAHQRQWETIRRNRALRAAGKPVPPSRRRSRAAGARRAGAAPTPTATGSEDFTRDPPGGKYFQSQRPPGQNITSTYISPDREGMRSVLGDMDAGEVGRGLIADAKLQFRMTVQPTVEHGQRYVDFRYVGTDGTTISRRFFRDRNGDLVVYHSYFETRNKGNGLATDTLRSSFDMYERLGVKRVEVSAALDNGGYTWARFGFLPDIDEVPMIKRLAVNWLDSRQAEQKLTPERRDLLRKMATNPHARRDILWRIADIRDVVGVRTDGKDQTVGMAILAGNNWHGTFDMSNKEQKQRLRAYVNRQLKKSKPTPAGFEDAERDIHRVSRAKVEKLKRKEERARAARL